LIFLRRKNAVLNGHLNNWPDIFAR